MVKQKSSLLPLIVVPLGGILILTLVYAGYMVLFLSLEPLMLHENEQGILTPMLLRLGYAALLLLVYWLIYRSKASELVKATALSAPLAMLIITSLIRFYDNLPVAFALAFGFIGLALLLIAKSRKPWFFYYAVAVGAAAGLFYGRPGV